MTTTTPGGPVNEVQRVGFSATLITGGTFRLTFGQEATPPLAYHAAAADVDAALVQRFVYEGDHIVLEFAGSSASGVCR